MHAPTGAHGRRCARCSRSRFHDWTPNRGDAAAVGAIRRGIEAITPNDRAVILVALASW
jgi:hypothetical protein